MSKALKMEGRLWVLRDPEGVALEDIDTDMIFHNAHLAITEVAEMGQHALGNLAGYEDFCNKAEPGDIILTGGNFGSGSSRQQAVDCFVSLGITLLLAESFGAIYKRNAINAGFPIMEAQGLSVLDGGGEPWVKTGDEVSVDLASGQVTRLSDGATHQALPMSGVQRDIYQAGDLFAYGRTL